mmetsp:Transcript_20414/g.24729  ORF Transcript_20414/g.24729 Transcript_20414/m.24729 type:complete len:283 (+) Transcript_20414:65-913(+)|eukprot:CAMPEP_0204828954 /NCGR_PEP_ID=MMETSP1346-20131115/6927_1 /ASSEMBLY_ACC=CAM_ASM_000771 /TAXON_ID=215587 /ORGANISM="Aplanochytrium stocchinoi, Strain GSBS06" /LENGTH=282 /DNA_ID=CAMNT_0051958379 /DNA_START=222 /DNA_END=1070 /DNA_ORIENTATION=+
MVTKRRARKDFLSKYPFADSTSTVESLLAYTQVNDGPERPNTDKREFKKKTENKNNNSQQPDLSKRIQEQTHAKNKQERTKIAQTEREIDRIRKEKIKEKEALRKISTNIPSRNSTRQKYSHNVSHQNPPSRSRVRPRVRKHILADPPFSWKNQHAQKTKDIDIIEDGNETIAISKKMPILELVDRLVSDPIMQKFLPDDAKSIKYFHYSQPVSSTTIRTTTDEAKRNRVFANIWNTPQPETPTSSVLEESQSRSTISDNVSTDEGESDSSQSSNWLGLKHY